MLGFRIFQIVTINPYLHFLGKLNPKSFSIIALAISLLLTEWYAAEKIFFTDLEREAQPVADDTLIIVNPEGYTYVEEMRKQDRLDEILGRDIFIQVRALVLFYFC